MATATPAMRAAQRAGVAFTLHEYAHEHGAEYGAEAVARLGLDPARVFKTLVLRASDGTHAVAIVPVAAQVDLKAAASVVGAKSSELAGAADAQRLTGYVLGGISPLGQKRELPTIVDESAGTYPTVFVSAGRRGLELELDPADLVRLTHATLAPVARW
jgi:Cys-tRNA(Pro)/Cys-tRNA(Cys) deacylase